MSLADGRIQCPYTNINNFFWILAINYCKLKLKITIYIALDQNIGRDLYTYILSIKTFLREIKEYWNKWVDTYGHRSQDPILLKCHLFPKWSQCYPKEHQQAFVFEQTQKLILKLICNCKQLWIAKMILKVKNKVGGQTLSFFLTKSCHNPDSVIGSKLDKISRTVSGKWQLHMWRADFQHTKNLAEKG